MLRLQRRSISILKYSSLTPIANPQVVNSPIPIQKVESAIDKNFIDELFPKSNHLVQLEQPVLPIEVLSMHKSLNYSRLMEKISAMNAAMDVGDIDQAEFIFHKVWRTNRIEMKKILDCKVFEKFIENLLALQLQDQENPDSRSFEIRALEWFKSMQIEFQVKPGCHTFALFISYFLESGNIKAAQEKIVEMEKEKFTVKQLIEDPLFEEESEFMALDAVLKQMGKSIAPPTTVDSLILSAIKESADNDENENLEDSIELKPTDTIGVSILRKTLMGKKDITELDKYSQQLWLEQRAYQAAQEQFEEMQKTIPESQKAVNQLPLDLITQWHESLKEKIETEMQTLDPSKEDQEYVNFLRLLTPDILARITITELMKFPGTTSSKNKESFGQIRTIDMVLSIGNSIHREYNLQQMNRKSNLRQLNLQRHIHKIHSAGKLFNMTLRKAIAKLSNDEEGKSLGWNPDWGNRNIVNVGSFLLNIAVNTIKLPIKITCPDSPSGFRTDHILALKIVTEWKKEKSYNMLKIHNALHDLLANSFTSVYPWSLPMLVAPLPWITLHSGGYLQHRFPLVRVVNNEEHNDYLKAAADKDHLSSVMRSLDVLGSTAWKVNEKIFKVASWFWNEGVEAPGIPLLVNLPEIPIPEDVDTNPQSKKRYQAEKVKRQHKVQNAFSERCNTNYKLDIAKSFLGEKIYFPHNLDFRGRAYPLPPHLNHMGNDINRGLLMFYERKPLGESGLRWLKIHISNLYGFDKASMDERCKFTEDNLENILDSARDPINGKKWWLKGDKPWQLLAGCFELESAMDLADPTTYECGLPIHQDGSCNGLQHYAALGGDVPGAKAVNLVPSDRPGDVYTGVAKLVQEKVDQDCLSNHPEALLMKNRINRKLVKQTVMTNTYGVTRIGARDQIHSRLKEARVNEDPKTALTDEQMKKCAGYITGKVFDAMKDMFEGAREIQIWLTDAAKIVTKSIPESQIAKDQLEIYTNLVKLGIIESPDKTDETAENIQSNTENSQINSILEAVKEDSDFSDQNEFDLLEEEDPLNEKEILNVIKRNKKEPAKMTSMTWTTPLGLPIVQPYRKFNTMEVKTFMQTFKLIDSSRATPVNPSKQASAFPPNFVHSLDASHMMLTSLACNQSNITFAAVHDSYWTHACDVDSMSTLLRETFVRLHSKNIMERLREELLTRYKSHRIAVKITLNDEQREKYSQLYPKKRKQKVIKYWIPFDLPPLPKRGELNVGVVRDSRYFFH